MIWNNGLLYAWICGSGIQMGHCREGCPCPHSVWLLAGWLERGAWNHLKTKSQPCLAFSRSTRYPHVACLWALGLGRVQGQVIKKDISSITSWLWKSGMSPLPCSAHWRILNSPASFKGRRNKQQRDKVLEGCIAVATHILCYTWA